MITDKEDRATKEKDIGQIVRYLSSTFNQATNSLERASRSKTTGPNAAYIMQSEFAYLLNELMQSPKCMQQKCISDCNGFIDQVMVEINKMSDAV